MPKEQGRIRRRDADDDLEEQLRRNGANSEEDEQPRARPSARSNQTGRVAGSRRLVPDEDNDEDDGGEQLPPFDRDTFENVKLASNQQLKMKNLHEAWEKLMLPNLDEIAKTIRLSAVTMTEAGPEGDENVLRESEVKMREFVDFKARVEAETSAVTAIRQQLLADQVPLIDPSSFYNNLIKKSEKQYAKKTSRQKYANDDNYRAFREDIWNVDHNEPMRPLTSSFPREEGDESDDDDMEIGGETQTFKCPLSGTFLENPVTSDKCKHSYSKEAIKDFLRKGPKQCPAVGCRVFIAMENLKEDPELQRKAKAAERKEKRQAERDESDDEILD